MKKTKILTLCECAIMLALSIVLSFVVVWKMPMGGGVTLLSMLPVLLVSLKHGPRWGLGTCAVFAGFQLIQGITSGEVFVHCATWQTVLLVAAFDYVVPYGCLGLAGFASPKSGSISREKATVAIVSLIILRFLCHFITGFSIWRQWAPEGMGKYVYSLIYNIQYMLPELILTAVAANIILSVPQMKKLLSK